MKNAILRVENYGLGGARKKGHFFNKHIKILCLFWVNMGGEDPFKKVLLIIWKVRFWEFKNREGGAREKKVIFLTRILRVSEYFE